MSISFSGLSCVKGGMAKTNRQVLVTAPSFRKGESTLKSYDRHPWGPYVFSKRQGVSYQVLHFFYIIYFLLHTRCHVIRSYTALET